MCTRASSSEDISRFRISSPICDAESAKSSFIFISPKCRRRLQPARAPRGAGCENVPLRGTPRLKPAPTQLSSISRKTGRGGIDMASIVFEQIPDVVEIIRIMLGYRVGKFAHFVKWQWRNGIRKWGVGFHRLLVSVGI